MRRIALSHRFASRKVPEVDGTFWFLKILTTAMGEATSDFFVHHYNPEVAVACTGVVFVAVLYRQLVEPTYRATWYWAAVVMVSVFGTMCADVVHVGLGVPYAVSTSVFAVALVVVFVSWSRVEHTLSIHSIVTTRRELFYWLAVTVTFALGTAVGDLTATTLHLGYFGSGVLFTVLFCLPAIGYAVFRLNSIAMFWTAYILTRPMGASFADWLGVSHERGGLDWGTGKVSLALSAMIVVTVALRARHDRSVALA